MDVAIEDVTEVESSIPRTSGIFLPPLWISWATTAAGRLPPCLVWILRAEAQVGDG